MTMVTCPACHGHGEVAVGSADEFGNVDTVGCPLCGEDGVVEEGDADAYERLSDDVDGL